ncbi:hypothetical protein HHI36_009411 [Cryptolaemus montrouzieri]
MFNIIRDPRFNYSRGQFFRLFREAIAIAEDRIESGNAYLPIPEELFGTKTDSEIEVDYEGLLSDSSDSSLSFDGSESENSYLVIPSHDYPELPDFYKLPNSDCKCDISVTSSIETLSEKSLYIEEEDRNSQNDDIHYNSEVEEVAESFSISDFYQPDRKIHSRFLDELEEEDEEFPEQEVEKDQSKSDLEYEWVNVIEKPSKKLVEKPKSIATMSSHEATPSVYSAMKKVRSSGYKSKSKIDRKSTLDENPSSQTVRKQKSRGMKEDKKLSEEETLKAWFEYNIWEQRRKNMADPAKGWTPSAPNECDDDCICAKIEYTEEDLENEEYLQIKNQWLMYLEMHKESITQSEHNKFINSCLLLIIKQFIFEYFYESFQYKLIKMTFQTPPSLILERLNQRWQIPKSCREEFKRPIEKKPKPPKPTKEKTPKGPKGKKEKHKEDKKSKSTKSGEKKEKKEKMKPEKPPNFTKEEKAELERLKREEQQRTLEAIAAEENKRLIFPLKLAANEDFFRTIFEGYMSRNEIQEKGKKKNK